MLKIFHKFFFENLNVPIPAFLTAKKFGLLKRTVRLAKTKCSANAKITELQPTTSKKVVGV